MYNEQKLTSSQLGGWDVLGQDTTTVSLLKRKSKCEQEAAKRTLLLQHQPVHVVRSSTLATSAGLPSEYC